MTKEKVGYLLYQEFRRRMMVSPPDPSSGKFLDEFRGEILAQGLSLPAELEVVGQIVNLAWPPPSGRVFDLPAFEHYQNEDPAVLVTGYSRLVVFWRIEGEIRYWAGRIKPGGQEWYRSGEDPNRDAAGDAESEYYEVAILSSVKDAVRLTFEYLTGKPLANIEVSRIKP